DLGAGDVRQHPVDENQVRLRGATQLDRVRAVCGFERLVALLANDLGHERANRTVVLDHQHAPLAADGDGRQVCVGGANPTRLASRCPRFGRLIRSTRFSPPSTMSARSQPSPAESFRTCTSVLPSVTCARVRTWVEYSHSRLGSPTEGTIRVGAFAPLSGALGDSGSSGSSGSSSAWVATQLDSRLPPGGGPVPPAGVEPALDRV